MNMSAQKMAPRNKAKAAMAARLGGAKVKMKKRMSGKVCMDRAVGRKVMAG